jgi:succinate dehydrogenase / fumarate reductase, flavoprotein subunit
MRIYPAIHYTMGGLWVDYNLESTIPGLFVLGEANFSDHGANRLGASALMQGLADGYFIIPYTMGQHLASRKLAKVTTDHPAFAEALTAAKSRVDKIVAVNGRRTVDSIHRDLGDLMWNDCGMSRTEGSLKKVIDRVRELRDEFWRNVKVPGSGESFNQNLEHAGRVADFLEFAELLALDALDRKESCGAHFREEYQTAEHEAQRDDEHFCYVAAWEFKGVGTAPVLHKESLDFEAVPLATRSYK